MDAMNSGDESDHDLISTKMLEDSRDGSQTHPNVNIFVGILHHHIGYLV